MLSCLFRHTRIPRPAALDSALLEDVNASGTQLKRGISRGENLTTDINMRWLARHYTRAESTARSLYRRSNPQSTIVIAVVVSIVGVIALIGGAFLIRWLIRRRPNPDGPGPDWTIDLSSEGRHPPAQPDTPQSAVIRKRDAPPPFADALYREYQPVPLGEGVRPSIDTYPRDRLALASNTHSP